MLVVIMKIKSLKINVTISNFSEELRSKYENDWKKLTGS